MTNRAATVLGLAAVVSSLFIYATFAQDPPQAPKPAGGAIVVGPPPIRLSQELPGRYQLSTVMESENRGAALVEQLGFAREGGVRSACCSSASTSGRIRR